ncbi:DNA primase [Marinagarivorans cellulosilyticus]|uniref:DNA primase n=1 Tax=Marinagarivorans cellulosilyticus TaxID=2721545 RepID=A0AAN1WH08_9GAMM|nr:DNA primase [Marinagarivorans cellulosilyticus]BCD97385.1 DNA primase [Marinagarivorans cellulosilyticus]
MSLIPQPFIDDLLNRLDIVDIVDKRVKLKKTGKNYSACCPFHNEKTPSFTVSQDKQFYYCFGCGASGNAVGFLMEFDKLGFVDAVEQLASSAGLQIPREEPKNKNQAPKQDFKNLYKLLADCSDYFQQQLKAHPSRDKAVSYLQNRGLTGYIAKNFGLGYAPKGWDNLLTKFGETDSDRKTLVTAGMLIEHEDENKRYDRFRDRIMFPILDIRGRTIGFGGRVLGEENRVGADGKKVKGSGPKYLNSPETPVFHKGKELYGLYQARQANRELKHLLVVEGYMDVIALAQYGINNAVATLGTACGEDHLKLAFKYTNTIVFCFDGDKAGRTAAKRALENALEVMTDGYQIKFLFLPEGQDPDTLVRQIGQDRFAELIQKGSPLEEFFFDVLSEGLNINTMEGRARLSKLAAPLLHKLPKSVYRELMFELLSQRTGLSLDILMELIGEPVPVLVPATAPTQTEEQAVPPSFNQGPPANNEDYAPLGQPIEQELEASHFPQQLQLRSEPRKKSSVELSPIRLATALLLEHPNLAHKLEEPELPETTENLQLMQLFSYLKQRENPSFASIIGYWSGRFGVEAQQQLTAIMANQLLAQAKRGNNYNDQQELQDALEKLKLQALERERQNQLAELKSRPINELSPEERQHFLQLLKVGKQVH